MDGIFENVNFLNIIIAEESAEYNDSLHPFHNSAVAFYNALVSMSITLSGFIAGYVSEG